MGLDQLEVLFIDCQTTGMRPPRGHVLELAWARGTAASSLTIHSELIRLPAGESIPKMVREITGMNDEDLAEARTEADVFADFSTGALQPPEPRVAVIHYAQFEKPFLMDLFERYNQCNELPLQVICSYQLCKRLLPGLPSQNIRGASGFFGAPTSHIQRAGPHVQATQRIWQGLLEKLREQGVNDLAALNLFLDEKAKVKTARYEYRLDKLKRLELPDKPGIYRMLAKSGDVLYVGKATSLKARVNSYFRGQKNRDRFKLEMLAQVWDLRVTECKSALEAALLESDEIKRYNPPYNIVLKRGRRHLLFYNRSFDAAAGEQSLEFPHGPFRNSNWIEHLRLVHQSLGRDEFLQIFFNPIPANIMAEGFASFCQQHGLDRLKVKSPRSLLAFGLWLHKHHVEPTELVEEAIGEDDLAESADEERNPTPEEVAAKLDRLFRRAAAEYLRGKKLTRLLNSDIELKTKYGRSRLRFRGGKMDAAAEANGDYPSTSAAMPQNGRSTPWVGMQIDDFDRMSILLSELAKNEHRIC